MRVENFGFLFARAMTEVLAICIRKQKAFGKALKTIVANKALYSKSAVTPKVTALF